MRSRSAHRPGTCGGPLIGGVRVRDIRLASNHELPAGTEVRITEAGRGALAARVRPPWSRSFIDLGQVRIVDGVVLLPDELFFAPAIP